MLARPWSERMRRQQARAQSRTHRPSRKSPDVQNSRRAMLVGVPFGKCDATVHDDGTVPVSAARVKFREQLPRVRLVNAQSPIGIVNVEQSASDHRTRSAIAIAPFLRKPTSAEGPRRRRAVVGSEHPRRLSLTKDSRRSEEIRARRRRYDLRLPTATRPRTTRASELEQS